MALSNNNAIFGATRSFITETTCMAADTRFEEIEQQIEALHERLDSCRQAIALSRAAIYAGGVILLLVLTVAGSYRTPVIVFGAITALLGGTVWFGANTSTRADVEGRLADAEALKARLFDDVAARNGWSEMTPTVH